MCVCLGVGVHDSGHEPVKIGGKTTTHSIVILDSGTELIGESPLYGMVVCCLFEASSEPLRRKDFLAEKIVNRHMESHHPLPPGPLVHTEGRAGAGRGRRARGPHTLVSTGLLRVT